MMALVFTPKRRAQFTRWICRQNIDPDGYHPWWRRVLMKYFFSHTVYFWLIAHPVWFEDKKRTDPVIWLAEVVARRDSL